MRSAVPLHTLPWAFFLLPSNPSASCAHDKVTVVDLKKYGADSNSESDSKSENDGRWKSTVSNDDEGENCVGVVLE